MYKAVLNKHKEPINKRRCGFETGGCFAAGTLVHTKDGLVPIEKIKVGDWVLSFPEDQRTPDRIRELNEYTYGKVTQVYAKEKQALSKVVVANLASGNTETIFVTPNHLIWCKGRGWILVGEMDIAGDTVETFRYGNLRVFRCFQNVDVGTVYNFEVDEYHTYYVGEEGVWVHSRCSPDKADGQ